MYLSERGATSISSCNLGKAKKAQTEKALGEAKKAQTEKAKTSFLMTALV